MEFLQDHFTRKGSGMIIIYGRRRTGKTRLIMESLKNRNSIYFMATETAMEDNIRVLSKRMGNYLKDATFHRIEFDSIEDLLEAFVSRVNGRTIIAIDEFPYLFKYRPEVLSELQRVYDEKLSRMDICLILCGSSISMMEQNVLSKASPLYGRRSGQWKLMPLPIGSIKEMLPKYSVEDVWRTYGVCDGIPEYILKFNKDRSFKWNMNNRVLKKGEYLSEEGRILLLQELSSIGNYMFILESIAKGHLRLKDISDHTRMDKGSVSKYISNLISLGIIEYGLPFGAPRNSRKGQYRFTDNYMDFYFKFLHPFRTDIEMDTHDLEKVQELFDIHMGSVFEKGIRDLIRASGSFKEASPWWHKGNEVDVVGTIKNEAYIGEVKWRKRRFDQGDLDGFLQKVEMIPLRNEIKRKAFVVSRGGFTDGTIKTMKSEGVLYFGIHSIEKATISSSFDPKNRWKRLQDEKEEYVPLDKI